MFPETLDSPRRGAIVIARERPEAVVEACRVVGVLFWKGKTMSELKKQLASIRQDLPRRRKEDGT